SLYLRVNQQVPQVGVFGLGHILEFDTLKIRKMVLRHSFMKGYCSRYFFNLILRYLGKCLLNNQLLLV
ncbi:MAG TPA: hypothetical protein PKJ08_13500, partial [Candidatus Cloacimonadota bacterium]|nr:hypothetical protein [Candidatus Cloacimonadota bacterium]